MAVQFECCGGLVYRKFIRRLNLRVRCQCGGYSGSSCAYDGYLSVCLTDSGNALV